MARTLNRALHTVRREAFLDAAQRLIQVKGYEAMSVQDVLDEVDTSRGAFYHYFDSKQALLEAVVERFADAAMAALAPVVADPGLPALRKLERVFGEIASFKADRKELVLAIVDVWTSDANAVVREKTRRMTTARMVPVLAAVIAQAEREGTVTPGPPEETATILLALLMGFQETATDLFLARRARAISFDEVERSVNAFTRSFERVVGAPPGALTLSDASTLHFWFG